MNGLWLLILLGRWSMITGWIDLLTRRSASGALGKREFVSVDALGGPYDLKMNTDPRSYEMLSRDKDELVTRDMFTVVREGPVYPPLRSYLAQTPTANVVDDDDIHQHHHQNSYESSNNIYATTSNDGVSSPPFGASPTSPPAAAAGVGAGRRTPDYFGATARYQPPTRSFSSPRPPTREGMSSVAGSWEQQQQQRSYSPPGGHHYSQSSYSSTTGGQPPQDMDGMNPLQMNRI